MTRHSVDSDIRSWDARRNLAAFATHEEALQFSTRHWIWTVQQAIQQRGRCFVALSGGATPKAIYQRLAQSPYMDSVDWSKVFLCWSDERAVPPTHPDSNYRMAMEAGLNQLPIPPTHILRMEAESSIHEHAHAYEETLRALSAWPLDLVMLGVGEDGHTASLFPATSAIHEHTALVTANFVPMHHSWRMTLTFNAINMSRQAVIYAFGASKQAIVHEVLEVKGHHEKNYPAFDIGTISHKALWIIDWLFS